MKKSKIIFSLLIAMIILVAMSVKSKAVTLSTSETPSTVNSGSEFNIVLKFDEKITGINAHILYDDSLITMSADNDQGVYIYPQYSKGDLSLMYSSPNKGYESFKIKAKAAEVTEEKVVEFKVIDLQAATESSPAETLESKTFKVTIKPSTSGGITVSTTDVKLNIGESTTIKASGTGTLTWKSSDEAIVTVDKNGKIIALKAGTATITVTDEAGKTKEIKVTVNSATSPVDTSVTNKKQLAKTGESSIILLIIGIIAIIAIVTGIKTKKTTKLFVMLPLLVAVTIAGKTAEAKTVGVAEDKTTTGILSENPNIKGIKVIGVSANDKFLALDKGEQKKDILLLSDLENFFEENSITYSETEKPTVISEDGKTTKSSTDKLATGDTIKSGNTEYKLVIFGDVNGDGEICKINDIEIIIHDYLGDAAEKGFKKAEGLTSVAANVYVEDDKKNPNYRYRLNVFDIHRMQLKYTYNDRIGDTLISNLNIFAEDEDDSAPVITPSGNISLNVNETKKLTSDKDVTWSSSDSTVVTVDENGKVKGIKEGTATITATDKKTGKTTTATVTVKDGVAQVGSETYKTVQEAIDSIKTTSETTVTLLKDIKDATPGEGKSTFKVSSSQNIVLDLNGHSLVGYSDIRDEKDGNKYTVINNGTLKIKNSSENVAKISTSDEFQSEAVRCIKTIGNLTIEENVLIEDFMSCITIDGTNTNPIVTMNGAKLHCKESGHASNTVHVMGAGVFTMNSGTIQAEGHPGIGGLKGEGSIVNIVAGTIEAEGIVGSNEEINIGIKDGVINEGPVLYSYSDSYAIFGSVGTLNFYQGTLYSNNEQPIDSLVENKKYPDGKTITPSIVNQEFNNRNYEFRARLDNE